MKQDTNFEKKNCFFYKHINITFYLNNPNIIEITLSSLPRQILKNIKNKNMYISIYKSVCHVPKIKHKWDNYEKNFNQEDIWMIKLFLH